MNDHGRATPTHQGTGGRAGSTDAGSGGFVSFLTGGSTGMNGAGGIMHVCGGQDFLYEPPPTSMYLMIDGSSAMSEPVLGSSPSMSSWDAVQRAVSAYVGDPTRRSLDTRIGLQFFPLQGDAADSCHADYATPEVEVAPLDDNAPALVRAFAGHLPTKASPMAPALLGAIAHMKTLTSSSLPPARAPVVVLITASLPTECDPMDVPALVRIAKQGSDEIPGVHTFIIALNLGLAGRGLRPITEAGSTGVPILIDGGDVVSQLVDALTSVRKYTNECTFPLPLPAPGTSLDPASVVVTLTPDSTKVEAQVPELVSADDCALNGDEGWSYDNPTSPSLIETCFGTCARALEGRVHIASGCIPMTPTF